MQTLKGGLAAVVALIACPCHLPLTLPLLLALTGGTAFGIWLAAHQWFVWGASILLFVGGLALAVLWMGKDSSGARCELPAQSSRRSHTSRPIPARETE